MVSDLRSRFSKRQNGSVTYKMLRIRLEYVKVSSSVKLTNILVSTSSEGKSIFFFLKISGCISFPFDSLIYFTLS